MKNKGRPGLLLQLGVKVERQAKYFLVHWPLFVLSKAFLIQQPELTFPLSYNQFVTGIAVNSSAAEAAPPEPGWDQPSCDPHGRSEAEESRTGLNPVCSSWLQFNGLRTTPNNVMLIKSLLRPETVYEEVLRLLP